MNRAGVVLTDRERRLLGYLAVARYLSPDQAQRILADDREPRIFCRRLRRIAKSSCGMPVIRAVAGPGGRDDFWALTAFGWNTAEKTVPYLRPPPLKDIAPETLRHHRLLTDVFVDMVLLLRQSPEDSVAALPFRWLVENDEHLSLNIYDRRSGLMKVAALRPDSILELPNIARRLFIEAETGARKSGITTGNISNTQALMRKIQRYGAYFTGFVDAEKGDTWYTKKFSRAFFPEVVVLVHSLGRKERVRVAVSKWLGQATTTAPFSVRILTFEEAAGALSSMLSGRKAASSRMLTVSEKIAFRIRDGFNILAKSYNDLRRAVETHNRSNSGTKIAIPGTPRESIVDLVNIVRHDLLAEPRPDINWASRLIDDGQRL